MSTGKEGSHSGVLNRRDLLRLAGCASTLPLTALWSSDARGNDVPVVGPGQVVRVHMPGMRGRFSPHPDAARIMVKKAMMTLTGAADPVSAWTKFIRPTDRVGIKVNLVGGRLSSTSGAVVNAIVEGLLGIGVRSDNITVFEQFDSTVTESGFRLGSAAGSVRITANDALGYETTPISVTGATVRLAKVFTSCTAVINVPVIKDHALAGVTCAFKNIVYGIVEKPRRLHRNLHEVLPRIFGHEAVRGRVRLTIVDGAFCLFDGGPRHNPDAYVTHDSIYATTDPVAMDAVAVDLIDRLRKENGLRSLTESSRPATYLELAARLGLGIAERQRIQLKTVALPRFSGSAA